MSVREAGVEWGMLKAAEWDPRLHPPVGGVSEEQWARHMKQKPREKTDLHHGGVGGKPGVGAEDKTRIKARPEAKTRIKAKPDTSEAKTQVRASPASEAVTRTMRAAPKSEAETRVSAVKPIPKHLLDRQRAQRAPTRVERKVRIGQPTVSTRPPHPVLRAIHHAKHHPDPAKRKRMEELVRKWHKAKAGK